MDVLSAAFHKYSSLALLTKISLSSKLPVSSDPKNQNTEFRVREIIKPLFEDNFIAQSEASQEYLKDAASRGLKSATMSVTLTEKGKNFLDSKNMMPPILRYGLSEMNLTPKDKVHFIMWNFLLTQGYHDDILFPYGDKGEVIHLIDCGLNFVISSKVNDDSWLQFREHEVETRKGLTGIATCLCGKVREYSMRKEIPSSFALLENIFTL